MQFRKYIKSVFYIIEGDRVVILWTIQTKKAYDILLKTGTLITDPNEISKYYIQPYQWMIQQMKQRININTKAEYPLWAWYQWQDSKRKIPDLRYSRHLFKGEEGVRIEFEIDSNLVLLSDFSTWNFILNGWYLPLNKEDADKNENLVVDKEIQKNWERIFDLEWFDEYINEPKDKKAIQATFWELKLEGVKRVKEFMAR